MERRIGISSAANDGVDGRQAGVGCGIDFLRCEKLAGNSRRMAPNILQGAGDSSASGAAQRGLTVVRLDYAKHFTNSTCYPQSDSPLRDLVLFCPCCTHTFQLRPCFLFPIRQFLQPAHLLILPGRPWRGASTATSRGLPRGRAHNAASYGHPPPRRGGRQSVRPDQFRIATLTAGTELFKYLLVPIQALCSLFECGHRYHPTSCF